MESGADEANRAHVVLRNCEIRDTGRLAIAHKWGTKARIPWPYSALLSIITSYHTTVLSLSCVPPSFPLPVSLLPSHSLPLLLLLLLLFLIPFSLSLTTVCRTTMPRGGVTCLFGHVTGQGLGTTLLLSCSHHAGLTLDPSLHGIVYMNNHIIIVVHYIRRKEEGKEGRKK